MFFLINHNLSKNAFFEVENDILHSENWGAGKKI